jgi:hypothetical protein
MHDERRARQISPTAGRTSGNVLGTSRRSADSRELTSSEAATALTYLELGHISLRPQERDSNSDGMTATTTLAGWNVEARTTVYKSD